MLGVFMNIAFAVANIAQYAVIVAETSRLPMVVAALADPSMKRHISTIVVVPPSTDSA